MTRVKCEMCIQWSNYNGADKVLIWYSFRLTELQRFLNATHRHVANLSDAQNTTETYRQKCSKIY